MDDLSSFGYEVVRDVLGAAEINSLREAIAESFDRVARALRAPFESSCPEASLENRIDRIAERDRVYGVALFRAALGDSHRDPRINALSVHPGLGEVVAERLFPMMQTGYTIRARASVPSLSSSRSPWHQDVVRETESGCGTVRLACWMPLADVDEYNGALEVIPGVWRSPLPHAEDGEGGRFFIPEENLPLTARQTVSLRCGDVLLINRFTPHRSLPITNGRARWAVVMWVKAV